jgi:hypothetical protein
VIKQVALLLTVPGLLLLNTTAIHAADPVGSAALTRIQQMRVAAGGDPAVATDFGFSSAAEMDGAVVIAAYPVYEPSPEWWTGDTPGSLELADTKLSWVVVGINNDPTVVVTVDSTVAGQPRAVEVGAIPAKQLAQAMAATNGGGKAVYLPQFVSAVVSGQPGAATVRPLMTQLAASRIGLAQGATTDEHHYAELARAHAQADIKAASLSPVPSASPASTDSQPDNVLVIATIVGIGLVIVVGGLLLAILRRRRRRQALEF